VPPQKPQSEVRTPRPNVATAIQTRYTTGARRLASQSVTGLARTRVTPNALTVSGVSLCIAGSVLVYFEYRAELLYYWLGAAIFLVGSVLDILDGALARAGGKSTPFGAFLDSTFDRVGEGFLLGAIALVFARRGLDWAIALAFASLAGSFLVSYTRAKAEIMGLKGDVGIGGRAERVVVLVGGLVFAPWGGLPWAIVFLTALTWLTVGQRIWAVRGQMLAGR
jgi:CDP-diacylglycerol--glycerol-3-phosphate 3-phosphatidyltransferase